jgi:hypothetical protein
VQIVRSSDYRVEVDADFWREAKLEAGNFLSIEERGELFLIKPESAELFCILCRSIVRNIFAIRCGESSPSFWHQCHQGIRRFHIGLIKAWERFVSIGCFKLRVKVLLTIILIHEVVNSLAVSDII